MTRQLFSTGSDMEAAAGYSRAVVDGPWCFVSGTTGYDYATMTMPSDLTSQTANALATIESTLEQAGFQRQDLVRMRYYITDPQDAETVFATIGPWLEGIRPAATMVVCQLIRQEMRIEIEATAFRQSESPSN